MANYPQIDDCSGVWKIKDVKRAVMGGYWRSAAGGTSRRAARGAASAEWGTMKALISVKSRFVQHFSRQIIYCFQSPRHPGSNPPTNKHRKIHIVT